MKTITQINSEKVKLTRKLAELQTLKRKRELAPLVGKYFMKSDTRYNYLSNVKSFDGRSLQALMVILGKKTHLSIQVFMTNITEIPGKEIPKKRFDKKVGAAIANFFEEIKK